MLEIYFELIKEPLFITPLSLWISACKSLQFRLHTFLVASSA